VKYKEDIFNNIYANCSDHACRIQKKDNKKITIKVVKKTAN